MIEDLFGSKTRANLLRTFFREPEKSYFVRELARMLDVQLNAVRRELELLATMGLVQEIEKKVSLEEDKEQGVGLRKYYALNLNAPLFPELQALLLKAQTVDEKELVNNILAQGGEVELFVLTGRFTGVKEAPVDILVVGKLKDRVIARLISQYEERFGFPIRYTALSEVEFFERRNMMDKFLYSIFEGGCLKVVNKLNV